MVEGKHRESRLEGREVVLEDVEEEVREKREEEGGVEE